jgi:hypothetical protein
MYASYLLFKYMLDEKLQCIVSSYSEFIVTHFLWLEVA